MQKKNKTKASGLVKKDNDRHRLTLGGPNRELNEQEVADCEHHDSAEKSLETANVVAKQKVTLQKGKGRTVKTSQA